MDYMFWTSYVIKRTAVVAMIISFSSAKLQISLILQEVALLTDGRFSGGSHGYVVGHICPEAQVSIYLLLTVDAKDIQLKELI